MSNATDVILRLLATSSDSNRSKRKRSSRHSSDEEISENEISDRSDVDEEEVDDDDDDDGPVDEYDDKLYGDAEDRARLMAMPEVEREQILFERNKRREMLLDQRQVAKRLKKQEEASRSSKKGSASARDSARRSTRAKDSKSGSTKALQDLKKAQERKKARRSYSPEPRHRRGSVDYSDKSEESAVSSESEYYSDRDISSKKKSSSKAKPKQPATLEDLNAIRLGRDKLEKWCFHPFFKDTVIGCFVRLSVGERGGRPVYRVCEVVGTGKYHKLYTLGQARTNITLVLRHGAAERPFTMDNLSNQPFTQDEFRRFEAQSMQDKVDMVDVDHIERKKKDLQHARDYVMTDKEIEDMIALKRAMNQGKLNPIVHRNILEQQKSTLQTEEEIEEAERQLQQLRQQEIAARDRRADQLDVWARLNERNRTINRTEGRQAEERQASARKQRSAAGKDNFDPFARLRTIPKMVHEDADSANNSSTPGSPGNGSGTGTPVASQSFSQGDTPTAQTVSATPKMPQSHYEELIAAHRDMFRIEVDLGAI
ncbi:hypothetical protein BGW42_005985 [Actinomortierella wolfii]|nr:hypothetical protein BGW42_005985 [Actinomortierella wolfii]